LVANQLPSPSNHHSVSISAEPFNDVQAT